MDRPADIPKLPTASHGTSGYNAMANMNANACTSVDSGTNVHVNERALSGKIWRPVDLDITPTSIAFINTESIHHPTLNHALFQANSLGFGISSSFPSIDNSLLYSSLDFNFYKLLEGLSRQQHSQFSTPSVVCPDFLAQVSPESLVKQTRLGNSGQHDQNASVCPEQRFNLQSLQSVDPLLPPTKRRESKNLSNALSANQAFTSVWNTSNFNQNLLYMHQMIEHKISGQQIESNFPTSANNEEQSKTEHLQLVTKRRHADSISEFYQLPQSSFPVLSDIQEQPLNLSTRSNASISTDQSQVKTLDANMTDDSLLKQELALSQPPSILLPTNEEAQILPDRANMAIKTVQSQVQVSGSNLINGKHLSEESKTGTSEFVSRLEKNPENTIVEMSADKKVILKIINRKAEVETSSTSQTTGDLLPKPQLTLITDIQSKLVSHPTNSETQNLSEDAKVNSESEVSTSSATATTQHLASASEVKPQSISTPINILSQHSLESVIKSVSTGQSEMSTSNANLATANHLPEQQLTTETNLPPRQRLPNTIKITNSSQLKVKTSSATQTNNSHLLEQQLASVSQLQPRPRIQPSSNTSRMPVSIYESKDKEKGSATCTIQARQSFGYSAKRPIFKTTTNYQPIDPKVQEYLRLSKERESTGPFKTLTLNKVDGDCRTVPQRTNPISFQNQEANLQPGPISGNEPRFMHYSKNGRERNNSLHSQSRPALPPLSKQQGNHASEYQTNPTSVANTNLQTRNLQAGEQKQQCIKLSRHLELHSNYSSIPNERIHQNLNHLNAKASYGQYTISTSNAFSKQRESTNMVGCYARDADQKLKQTSASSDQHRNIQPVVSSSQQTHASVITARSRVPIPKACEATQSSAQSQRVHNPNSATQFSAHNTNQLLKSSTSLNDHQRNVQPVVSSSQRSNAPVITDRSRVPIVKASGATQSSAQSQQVAYINRRYEEGRERHCSVPDHLVCLKEAIKNHNQYNGQNPKK